MELDAVKVDPKHYTVEFENEHVRAVRVRYGPHEKSGMHEHPNCIGVFLTDGKAKFAYPDGTAEEVSWKVGETMWFPAVKHDPENLSDAPMEAILIELK